MMMELTGEDLDIRIQYHEEGEYTFDLNDTRYMVGFAFLEELFDKIHAVIGADLFVKDAARREFTRSQLERFVDDGDEDFGFPRDDPGHPGFREGMAELWDNRDKGGL